MRQKVASDAEQLRRREQTREAAAAFVEDMDYVRDLIARRDLPASEIRRLSAVLRRILVDHDLRKLAPPRIGRVKISAPDNGAIYRASRSHPVAFFVSGGPSVFGHQCRAIVVPESLRQEIGTDVSIELSVESFAAQQVLCLRQTWATRKDVIEYLANTASGVHSSAASTTIDHLLERLRRFARVYVESNGALRFSIALEAGNENGTTPPFKWSAKAFDFVLLELVAAAHFLANSPDVHRLETMIRSELSADQ